MLSRSLLGALGALLFALACCGGFAVPVVGCGGSSVVLAPESVTVSEWLIVRDAQGDVIAAWECAGTLDERTCLDPVTTIGITVEAGAEYGVPILGTIGARLFGSVVLDEGATIRVEPVVGPFDVPAFETGSEQ